jgi:hypothetical protein
MVRVGFSWVSASSRMEHGKIRERAFRLRCLSRMSLSLDCGLRGYVAKKSSAAPGQRRNPTAHAATATTLMRAAARERGLARMTISTS